MSPVSGGVDCAELGSAAALEPAVVDESAGAAVVPPVAGAIGDVEAVELSAGAAALEAGAGGDTADPVLDSGEAGVVLADASLLTVGLSEGALAVEDGSLASAVESSTERSCEVERAVAARWEDFVLAS